MTIRPRVWVAPNLLRTATAGYVLRVVWSVVALAAMVEVVARGPLPNPAGSLWLRVGLVLLLADLLLWIIVTVVQYAAPALGTTGYATPLVTGLPVAAQFFSQAPNAVSHATTIILIPFLVLLTGYTITVHVLVVRAQPRPGDPVPERT